ncbi:HAD family hydrolase [Xanthovirga aplysinae]|uniref:HAD family hydrolase n=1 Tax=Xanthovirga aplysinae TaxID=2529853 RepID=UPI0012BD6E85|nr:HAD family hydrolase [Xanthovirga aplysinae]MTI30301.1 HAD family hydrolase [Xanthovirga aplysinae]
MIKALILDLDDTIFPTRSIDPNMLKPFLDKLEEVNDVLTEEYFEKAKVELWKRPFNMVADKFGFSERMIRESIQVLNNLELDLSISPFSDYRFIQKIPLNKFLVTTGFKNIQWAKIHALNLVGDYKEIFIDDPINQKGGKVQIFNAIREKYGYLREELLIIGDNPESEIKAGKELGMHTLLIDRNKKYLDRDENTIINFSEIVEFLKLRKYN